jgi:hypothetical protein
MVGATTTITFHYGLGNLTWKGDVLCFALGFGFTLAILTLVQGRAGPGEEQSGLFPPLWVRQPVLTALFVGMGAMWVDQQKITTGARRGDHVLLDGPSAIAAGILLMAAMLPMNLWPLFRRPRTRGAVAGGIAGLLVVAAGMGFAVVRILRLSG